MSSSEKLTFFWVTPAPGAPEPDGLHVRRADPADGPRYAADIGTDSASSFRRRLSRTTSCFVAELDGRLVHASWVTTSGAWTRELQLYVVPPGGGDDGGGEAYVYESFTRADARGKGAYPKVLRHIESWAAASGLSRLWVAVESSNAPSRRAIAKAGYSAGFELAFERRLGRMSRSEPVGPLASVGRRMLVARA